jgi:hypothetical protein
MSGTLVIGDTFSGSGALVGSTPAEKLPAVSAWLGGAWQTGISGLDYGGGSWQRAAGGATHETTINEDVLRTASVTTGGGFRTNLFVIEVAFYGDLDLLIDNSYVIGYDADYYSFGDNNGGSGLLYTSAGGRPALGTLTTYRFESSGTESKVFVNNVEHPTWKPALTFITSRIGFRVSASTGAHVSASFPFTSRCIYFHARNGVTSSGPLGSPYVEQGGTNSLPRLVFDGGEYRKGRAGLYLPVLSNTQPVPAPSFWANRLRSRETA